MFEQIIRHKYFFHIVAIIVILTATILFIVFSGDSVETHNGTTNMIKTTVGSEFVITLDANATTGYEWQLAKPIDDNLLNLVRSEYIPDETGLVGSGGKSIWTFKAIQAGETRISFKYIRSWEKDIPPVKEAIYIVNIEDAEEAEDEKMVDEDA